MDLDGEEPAKITEPAQPEEQDQQDMQVEQNANDGVQRIDTSNTNVEEPEVKDEPLQLMEVKPSQYRRISLRDDYAESQTVYHETTNIKIEDLMKLSLIDRLCQLAEGVASIIKSRRESVMLFSHLNQQLEENAEEIVQTLAKESHKNREALIKSIFLEVVKLCNKETFI